jgi:hypothetical protein
MMVLNDVRVSTLGEEMPNIIECMLSKALMYY